MEDDAQFYVFEGETFPTREREGGLFRMAAIGNGAEDGPWVEVHSYRDHREFNEFIAQFPTASKVRVTIQVVL